jgi:Bacterial Ig-like domain
MRINALLTITLALGLAACQTTPIAKPPIVTVEPGPVDTTPKPDPKPDPKPVIADDAPGSSGVTTTALTMLTAQVEKPGEQLPLINLNAEWVAFQDGTGPWKVLEGTNGVYPFEVTNKAGKYGLAYVCPKQGTAPAAAPQGLEMRLFTLADIRSPRVGCNVPSTGRPPGWQPPSKTTFKLSGTVKGLNVTESATAQVSSGLVGTGINVAMDGTFSQALPEGKYNLLVAQLDKPTPGSTNPPITKFKKMILERDLNLNADATRDFDFATQGFSPVTKTLTVNGLQAGDQGYSTVSTFLGTTQFSISSPGIFSSANPNVPIDVIPENQLQTGDVYGVQTYVNRKQGRDSSGNGVITSGQIWTSSITMPAVPIVQVTAEAELPYTRAKIMLEPLTNSAMIKLQLVEDVYSTTSPLIYQRSWNVLASGSWFGISQSFTVPDFSTLTGWKPELGFQKLSDMGWIVAKIESNISLRYKLSSFGDSVAQREYTATEFTQDFQNLNAILTSFNHPTADKVKPIVANTIPSNLVFGSTENITLANTKNLEIQFSEEMDPASVLAAYESISLPANNVTFSWKARFGQPNTILVITPNAVLTVGSTYSFTLGVGAKDISGNPLAAAKTFSFKVIP